MIKKNDRDKLSQAELNLIIKISYYLSIIIISAQFQLKFKI